MSLNSANVRPLPKTYKINEFFYSLQGEGVRAGTPNLFLRFSGCNLACSKDVEGFDCDTEFTSGERQNSDQILKSLKELSPQAEWVILTGGEPSLQVDEQLIHTLKSAGYKLAIETNGLREVSAEIDWICVSPKTAEHTIRQRRAHELKYVRAYGQGIPVPVVEADHYLISPAFEGEFVPGKTLEWCIDLVKKNPRWRLSLQTHKIMKIR